MKITVILSPRGCTGVSTIANYLMNGLIKPDTKETALLIEFNYRTGKSIFMNKCTTERNKCLSNVVINTNYLKENLIKSNFNNNCFFICQNINNTINDLAKFPIDCMASIIDEVRETVPVDHLIIDLPSELTNECRLYVLSNKFKYKIDNMFIVLDEDALTFKCLKDMSELATIYNDEEKLCTYIVNKKTENYVEYIDKFVSPGFLPINMIHFPYIPEMNDITNRGNIYSMGKDVLFKDMMNSIEKMVSIIVNKEAGYGLNFEDDFVEYLIKKRYNLVSLDSEPDSKKERQLPKNKKEKKSIFGKKQKLPKDNTEDTLEIDDLEIDDLEIDDLEIDNLDTTNLETESLENNINVTNLTNNSAGKNTTNSLDANIEVSDIVGLNFEEDTANEEHIELESIGNVDSLDIDELSLNPIDKEIDNNNDKSYANEKQDGKKNLFSKNTKIQKPTKDKTNKDKPNKEEKTTTNKQKTNNKKGLFGAKSKAQNDINNNQIENKNSSKENIQIKNKKSLFNSTDKKKSLFKKGAEK